MSATGHPRDPALAAILGIGLESEAGEWVDVDRALQVAAVWACVRILSRSVAKLPWPVWRRLDGAARELAPDRAQYRLLHERPNPEMGAFDFRETMMAYALTHRMAIAEIERAVSGKPLALWPIHPDRVLPERDAAGVLRYRVYTSAAVIAANGDPRKASTRGSVVLDQADVFLVRGMSFDGVTAVDVIAQARESLGLTLAMERCSARVFGNGAMPGVILEHPGALSEGAMERLRKSWDAGTTGRNQHGTRIAEEGMNAKLLERNLRDQQSIEGRTFQIDEVCRWYGVPPHKVYQLLRATFSNIEHQSLEFSDDSVGPWAIKLNQEATHKLFTPVERRTYYAELDLGSMRQVPVETQARVDSALVANGVITVNEARRRQGLNPLAPEIGDVLRVPVNTTTTLMDGRTPDAGSETDRKPGLDATGVDEE